MSVLVFLTFSLNAQDNDLKQDTIRLKETIVKSYRASKLMPLTYTNVKEADINVYNQGQDPSQILEHTPAVNSFSDAGNYYGYSYFRLRGIDQTRINMTLDGIPLNEPEDQGVYFSNFPDFLSSVKSFQVQRGVGTSYNGTASYAGSISFESPDLDDSTQLEFGANYGSYNSYRLYEEVKTELVENQALYVRVSEMGSDGYKTHSGNRSRSAFISTGLLKGKHSLKLLGFMGQQKNELAWAGVPLLVIDDDPQSNGNNSREKDKFAQAFVSLQYSNALSSCINLNGAVYYNYLDGYYDFDFNQFQGLPLTDELYKYQFKHHFTGALSTLKWKKNRWEITSGLHANRFQRMHVGSELSLGELYANTGFKNEHSVFTKVLFLLGKVSLFGDLQYRYTEFDYTGDVAFEKIAWQFMSPKIGLSYALKKGWEVYYSYGETGREPTRTDLFMGEDNLLQDEQGKALFVDINPEYVKDHEMGIRTKGEQFQLNANLYYMSFINEIVLSGQYGPNALPLHSNVTKSFRSGVELDFLLNINHNLSYSMVSSFAYNRISESGTEFQPVLSPPFMHNQSLSYQLGKFHTSLSTRYQSASYIDYANETRLPESWQINWASRINIQRFEFNVGVNNLTNNRILSNGYMGYDGTPLYFVSAPFNFNAGIKWIY